MEFITNVSAADMLPIKLIAEAERFAVYGSGRDAYLLIERNAVSPHRGIRITSDCIPYLSDLLVAAARDFRAQHDTASERADLYQDDLTEERQVSPVHRDKVAGSIVMDPIEGDEGSGQPLTAR
jgi:hypothetical protein